MKSFIIISALLFTSVISAAQQIIADNPASDVYALEGYTLLVDPNDDPTVLMAASLLRKDIKAVTGDGPVHGTKPIIIAGSLGRSALIQRLVDQKKINVDSIRGKWEAYQIQLIANPDEGVPYSLVIAGSDRRGTAYGLMELSRQLGVSPWYWWADVPVKKRDKIFIRKNVVVRDAPKVRYRGIFINDEAPALSNWSREKFGGFNHLFYEHVFELMLRLKANYIWPAMWGNAFYDDDTLNIRSADTYGIVIGTSHHEPLMRAHDEWRRHGTGKWNYDSNTANLRSFWKKGMERATNEKIVSIGMRGDGDEPMTRETATALLERIVNDQRTIIADVSGKPASETPQLWALYKEVQDYYDKGMRVPDDVTLLLCDDNWGNIRKLPSINEAPRKGGYGIYYHFDYVGGPRNYKWVNTNPLPRVWEQMHLAWAHNARQIWIVNVGDIKPMELPISFFLDYAWDPERICADDLSEYTRAWAAAQFGEKHAKAIAGILSGYAKYNSRRKPELLDERTFADLDEFRRVTQDYVALREKAEQINKDLSPAYRDAYFQLVLHPVKACSNLYELYFNVAMNRKYHLTGNALANDYADKAKECYLRDSLITIAYHSLNKGKWNHMMSQAHIGYTNWQQPPHQKMPEVNYLSAGDIHDHSSTAYIGKPIRTSLSDIPKKITAFFEADSKISIEAAHFTKANAGKDICWKILPDHGRTGDAITSFPVTAASQSPGNGTAFVEYEFYSYSKDSFKIAAYFSPTLNFHNTATGLRYGISVDDETAQIISINGDDKETGRGIWNKWVSENIIIRRTGHHIAGPGKHILKYWMVDSGVVLQKLVVEFGKVVSYLGPVESRKGNAEGGSKKMESGK